MSGGRTRSAVDAGSTSPAASSEALQAAFRSTTWESTTAPTRSRPHRLKVTNLIVMSPGELVDHWIGESVDQ
jgi:hypothetical protein